MCRYPFYLVRGYVSTVILRNLDLEWKWNVVAAVTTALRIEEGVRNLIGGARYLRDQFMASSSEAS
jgi:hypothetical protein